MLLCNIVSTLCILLGVSLAQGNDRTDVPITDERVQRYARMAVEYQNVRNKENNLPEQELNGVKRAQTQVVNAIYYYITMTVRQVGCGGCNPEECEAIIFSQAWTNTEEVTSMVCNPVTRSLHLSPMSFKAGEHAPPSPIRTRDNNPTRHAPPIRYVANFAVQQYNIQSDSLYSYSLEGVVSYTKKVNAGIKYNLILTVGNPTCKIVSLVQNICHKPRQETKLCRASVWYRPWLRQASQYQVLGTVNCTREQPAQI